MRLFVVLCCLSGCESYTASLPDGGRGQVNCPGAEPTVPVTVFDRSGAPAPAATVTAVWLSYDEITLSFSTNARGVAVIPSQFGPGQVRVKASLNDLSSESGEVTFSGGDCVTAVTPNNLALNLK
jgi:hypothetical protein